MDKLVELYQKRPEIEYVPGEVGKFIKSKKMSI
jgi:hypothetical protein